MNLTTIVLPLKGRGLARLITMTGLITFIGLITGLACGGMLPCKSQLEHGFLLLSNVSHRSGRKESSNAMVIPCDPYKLPVGGYLTSNIQKWETECQFTVMLVKLWLNSLRFFWSDSSARGLISREPS